MRGWFLIMHLAFLSIVMCTEELMNPETGPVLPKYPLRGMSCEKTCWCLHAMSFDPNLVVHDSPDVDYTQWLPRWRIYDEKGYTIYTGHPNEIDFRDTEIGSFFCRNIPDRRSPVYQGQHFVLITEDNSVYETACFGGHLLATSLIGYVPEGYRPRFPEFHGILGTKCHPRGYNVSHCPSFWDYAQTSHGKGVISMAFLPNNHFLFLDEEQSMKFEICHKVFRRRDGITILARLPDFTSPHTDECFCMRGEEYCLRFPRVTCFKRFAPYHFL